MRSAKDSDLQWEEGFIFSLREESGPRGYSVLLRILACTPKGSGLYS